MVKADGSGLDRHSVTHRTASVKRQEVVFAVGTVMWHFEISDASPEEVGEWLFKRTAGSQAIQIDDNAYHLSQQLVRWMEQPYRLLLPVRKRDGRLTPWSIQFEIREGDEEGTYLTASCNAGGDLLDYFRQALSEIREHWPGLGERMSTKMRSDGEPDRAVGEYFAGSGRMFVDWLKETIDPQSLIAAPGEWKLKLDTPRGHYAETIGTVEIDVEILGPSDAEGEELGRYDRCPGAIKFVAKTYELQNSDAFGVKGSCHDPYRANCEEVRALRDMLGRGDVDGWPMVDPMPLVAFFDELWEKIQASWQRPERSVPGTMNEDQIPESEAWAERSQEGMEKRGSETEQKSSKPWELIPEHRWDRTAVKMWCEGYLGQEIANRVNVTAKTVHNRLSRLRQLYPDADIPLDSER